MNRICHDCNAIEGQLHELGCDMERCPICGHQLISCGHYNQVKKYNAARIPWVEIPTVCVLCGAIWPELFIVPDSEWVKFVIPPLQPKVLCML